MAETRCEDFSGNTKLATVKDLETFNFLTQFARFIIPNNNFLFFHFGLERKGEGHPLDPLSFEFLDGSTFNDDFGDTAGVFPWRGGEPSNFFNNNRCVQFAVSTVASDFNDVPCSFAHSSFCERPCSVINPTTSPTEDTSSFSPTNSLFESNNPSFSPTVSPIKGINPTVSPIKSINPTVSPTSSPGAVVENGEVVEEVIFSKKTIFLSGAVVSGVLFLIFICLLFKKVQQYRNLFKFSNF